MNDKIVSFLQKNKIELSQIKYILSESPSTTFYLKNGEYYSTNRLNLKSIFAYLPHTQFLNVQKGIILSISYISSISDEGLYTMQDGKTFLGRQRSLKEHKENRKLLEQFQNQQNNPDSLTPVEIIERCAFLENMPIAFCIIELVFDQNGHGIDFLFRYCNKEMEHLEGLRRDQMLDHSFYEIFKDGDKKWLITYADVALNGVTRIIEDYSPEIDKHLKIYCHQPYKGYCACALVSS